MTANPWIAFINPTLALTFALAFGFLWHMQRDRGHLRYFAWAFVCNATGFIIQFGDFFPVRSTLGIDMANLVFSTGMALLMAGVVQRYGRPAPWALLGPLIAVCSTGPVLVERFGLDVTLRAYVANFSGGTMMLLGLFLIRQQLKTAADKVLFWVFLAAGLHFFPRTILTANSAYLTGDHGSSLNFDAPYALTLTFAIAIFSLLVALSLLAVEMLEAVEKLRDVSRRDPLTGVLNRRGLTDLLEEQGVIGPGVEHALVVADIDHFKSVNDRFGHSTGDRVLQAFAARLESLAAPGMHVVRLGGEEFAVILPACTIAGARLFCEGVRAALAANPCAALDSARVTASFGITLLHANEPADGAICRADKALYEAKRKGRDRIEVDTAECLRGGTGQVSPDATENIAASA